MNKMRTTITYKDSEKWLYEKVNSHSGKGNWIKDLLKDYYCGELAYRQEVAKYKPIKAP